MQNEQYPMPAMNEQERQELIRFNVAKLRAITPQFMKEKSPGVKKHLQSEINSAKIALAALTAKPVASTWLTCPDEMSRQFSKANESLAGISETVHLYTSPPVQFLRPVELTDSQEKARIDYNDDSFGYEG